MDLSNYVKVYDDALDARACDDLIKLYYEHEEGHHRLDNNGWPNFTQLNFTKNKHLNLDLHNYIIGTAQEAIKAYKNIVPETAYWPEIYGWEEMRIKSYNNDGYDQFDTHVDAITLDSMNRFFAFFWYLNDVSSGGETQFPELDMAIKPKKGRLVMFPPLWMFPHKGNPTITDRKYLLSSYLRFTE